MTSPSSRFKLIIPGDTDPVEIVGLNNNTTLLDKIINADVNSANNLKLEGIWNWGTSKVLSRFNSTLGVGGTFETLNTLIGNKGFTYNFKNTSQVTIAGGAATNYAQLCVSADLMSNGAAFGNPYCKITAQGALTILGAAGAGATIDVYVYIGGTDGSAAPVDPTFALGSSMGCTKIQLSTSNIGKRVPFYLSTMLDLHTGTPNNEWVSLNFSYDTSLLPGTASVGLSAPDSALGFSQLWVHPMGANS